MLPHENWQRRQPRTRSCNWSSNHSRRACDTPLQHSSDSRHSVGLFFTLNQQERWKAKDKNWHLHLTSSFLNARGFKQLNISLDPVRLELSSTTQPSVVMPDYKLTSYPVGCWITCHEKMTGPCITWLTNCSIHTFPASLFALLNKDVKGDIGGGRFTPSYTNKRVVPVIPTSTGFLQLHIVHKCN